MSTQIFNKADKSLSYVAGRADTVNIFNYIKSRLFGSDIKLESDSEQSVASAIEENKKRMDKISTTYPKTSVSLFPANAWTNFEVGFNISDYEEIEVYISTSATGKAFYTSRILTAELEGTNPAMAIVLLGDYRSWSDAYGVYICKAWESGVGLYRGGYSFDTSLGNLYVSFRPIHKIN